MNAPPASGGDSSPERSAPPAAADDSGQTSTFEDTPSPGSATGKPASTLRLDPAEGDAGGVSIRVVIAAATGALALLFAFRRRLRGLLPL